MGLGAVGIWVYITAGVDVQVQAAKDLFAFRARNALVSFIAERALAVLDAHRTVDCGAGDISVRNAAVVAAVVIIGARGEKRGEYNKDKNQSGGFFLHWSVFMIYLQQKNQ